jgi:predicted acetyltransferase
VTPPPKLRLRPLGAEDEDAFAAGHRAMAADDFIFGLGYEPGMPWLPYVDALERARHGLDLPDGHVPATFLVADVAGQIVGRTSIRHELNDFLAREGGHIGYGVLADHRRRGYATEILRQSLAVAREHGIDRVLVTCDDDNVASAAVIERCGGRRDAELPLTPGPPHKRRYWIT